MILVEEVLKDFGVEYEDKGNDFVVSCPYHAENHPSFYIQKEEGYYNCFSCQASGNFFSFVRLISGFSVSETLQYLSRFIQVRRRSRLDMYNDFLGAIQRQAKDIEEEESHDVIIPDNIAVRSNKYLIDRGFSNQEIIQMDTRICNAFPYKNWILIPVYRNGIVQTYFLREIKGDGKIYGYKTIVNEDGSKKNEGYYRSNILYGMDSCIDKGSAIAVCEGIFDSVFNKRYIKQSVAALSNRILPEQLSFLSQYSEVIIIPDNDMRGLFLVDSAMSLTTKIKVSVAQLPGQYKDSGEAKDNDIVIGEAIENRIPVMNFIVSPYYRKFMHYKKYELKNKKKY